MHIIFLKDRMVRLELSKHHDLKLRIRLSFHNESSRLFDGTADGFIKLNRTLNHRLSYHRSQPFPRWHISTLSSVFDLLLLGQEVLLIQDTLHELHSVHTVLERRWQVPVSHQGFPQLRLVRDEEGSPPLTDLRLVGLKTLRIDLLRHLAHFLQL